MATASKTQQTPAAGQRAPSAAKPAARTPAPPAASPARALQQRVGNEGAQALMQQKAAGARKGPKEKTATPESSEVVDVSSGTFNPSQKVQGEIRANPKGLMVRVAAKGIAGEGTVKIKPDGKTAFRSVERGFMPLLGEWSQMLGGLYLNVTVASSSQVTGNVSLKPNVGPSKDWLKFLQDNANLLGGAGLKVEKLPTPENKFENGKLTLGVKKLNVEIGGFLSSDFNIAVENGKPVIDASATLKIGGTEENKLILSNEGGALHGQASLAVTFRSFNGSVLVKYNADGTVDIGGKAAYNADKLSGEIEFIATDVDAANKFAKDAIAAAGGLENVQQAAAPPPVPAPQTGKKKRALAATGLLTFNLTQWFAGTVNVVVDGMGQVTVIGKIAPPAEIPLFSQKDWDKELFKLEAKAYYGIPVVGNLNLFANISLHAIAKLGPAKIYKIEVLGTYSTDPTVQKNIQISGSINISAYAGLRLRAEGGAGIEILDHDLKFGVGVNADVGVKAYAEARPTLGFREPGEFYISGTLEMIAQPMLGLSGDFFIELDTPWWSPLSDDRWTWPLFTKEWPLTDPIGINAVVKDYVLGSGKVPEIEMKPPEFDPSKFMTNMVDDKLPGKSGKGDTGQGTFKDDGSVQKPVVPPKLPAPPKPAGKPGKKGAAPGRGKSAKPDPKAQADQSSTKALKSGLDALKKSEPYSKAELGKALGALKAKVKGVSFNYKLQGEKWIVTAGGGGKKKSAGQSIELKAKKESLVSDNAQRGLAALDQVMRGYMAKGATLAEMTTAVKSVKRKFGFKSLEVSQNGGFWYLNYEINPKGTKKGPKAVGEAGGPAAGDTKTKGAQQEGQDDVRFVAAEMISKKLGSEASAIEARDVLRDVLGKLRAKGLVALILTEDSNGDYRIQAQASPLVDLFRLLPKIKQSFMVKMAAKVFLTGTDPATAGVTNINPFRTHEIKDKRFTGGVRDTFQTSQVVIPPGEQLRSSATVVQPKDDNTLFDKKYTPPAGLQTVEFVSGNTGEAMYMSNSSHAEEQFANWYINQPGDWQKRVVRIEVFVTHSPCGQIHQTCTASLVHVLNPNISPNVTSAALRWGKVWVDDKNPPASNTSTTPADVAKLEVAGWRTSGPAIKGATRAVEEALRRLERLRNPVGPFNRTTQQPAKKK